MNVCQYKKETCTGCTIVAAKEASKRRMTPTTAATDASEKNTHCYKLQ